MSRNDFSNLFWRTRCPLPLPSPSWHLCSLWGQLYDCPRVQAYDQVYSYTLINSTSGFGQNLEIVINVYIGCGVSNNETDNRVISFFIDIVVLGTHERVPSFLLKRITTGPEPVRYFLFNTVKKLCIYSTCVRRPFDRTNCYGNSKSVKHAKRVYCKRILNVCFFYRPVRRYKPTMTNRVFFEFRSIGRFRNCPHRMWVSYLPCFSSSFMRLVVHVTYIQY